jgi:hypothetical protein
MNKNINTPNFFEEETDLSLAFGNVPDKDNKKSKYLNVLKSRDNKFSQESKVHNLAYDKRHKALKMGMIKDISSPDEINNSLKKSMKVEGAMDAVSIAEAAISGGPVLSLLLTEGLKNKILGLVVDDKKQNLKEQDDMPAFQRDHELSMELTPTYNY